MPGLESTLDTSPHDSYERCARGHTTNLILDSLGGSYECAGCGLSFDSEAARLMCECGPWCVGCLMKNERNRRQHEEVNGSPTVAGAAAAIVSGLRRIPPFRRGLLTLYECPRNNCRAAPSTAVFPCPCERCGLNVQPLSGYQCLSCSPPFFSICVNCCVHSSVTRRGGPEGRVSSSAPRRRSVVDYDGHENGDNEARLDAHSHNNGESIRTRGVARGVRRRAASTNDAVLLTESGVSDRGHDAPLAPTVAAEGSGAQGRGGGVGNDTELENVFLNQMQGLRAQLERLALRLNEQELQAPDCNPDPTRFTTVTVNGLYCPPRTPHHPKMAGMDALNAMLGSRGRGGGQGATHSNTNQHEEDDINSTDSNNTNALRQRITVAVVPPEEGAFVPSVLGNITTSSGATHVSGGEQLPPDGVSSTAHTKGCHPLVCSHYGRLPWSCDDCGKDFSARSVGLQCRRCHYDKCLNCAMKVNGIIPLCPFPHKCSYGIHCPKKMAINTYSGPQECVQCGRGFGLWQGYVCEREHDLDLEEEKDMDKERRGGGGGRSVRAVAICVPCAMHNHNEVNPSLPPLPLGDHQTNDDLAKVKENASIEPHFQAALVKIEKAEGVSVLGALSLSTVQAHPSQQPKTKFSPFAVCSSSEECSICLMPCDESPDFCDDNDDVEEDNSRLVGEESREEEYINVTASGGAKEEGNSDERGTSLPLTVTCAAVSTNVAKERLAVRVSCPGHHIFHTSCIAAWLQTQQVCPVCRTDIAGR